MIDLMISILIASLAVSYITRYLLLSKRTSHFGFLSSRSKVIKFSAEKIDNQGFTEVIPEHIQPVMVVNYLHRTFRAFDVKGSEWIVTANADVWTCPFCLSFWSSFGGTAYVAYLNPGIEIITLFFIHFAITGLVVWLTSSQQEGAVNASYQIIDTN